MNKALYVIHLLILCVCSTCASPRETLASEDITLTGSLYTDQLEIINIDDTNVNPFYAFWLIRCYNFDGNIYQAQLDESGYFSIKIPSESNSYFLLFFDQNESFQAALCFPHYGTNSPNSYYAFCPTTNDRIDFGKLRVEGHAAVPSISVQQSINIDKRHHARDTDNDGIPDGFDLEHNEQYYADTINFHHDLDNDGIPDNTDLDIDGDALPNNLDSDIDDDGLPNDQDDDNTNDGISDSIAQLPPYIAIDSRPDELSDIISLPITVTDDNGDPVSLTVKYSIDNGTTYHPATLVDTNIKKLSAHPIGIKHIIMWDTKADFGSANIDSVSLEITPFDNHSTGQPLFIHDIKIRNNHPPKIFITNPHEGHQYTDSISIEWNSNDPDTDQKLSVQSLWMTFDNDNFVLLSDDVPASGTYEWDIKPFGYQKTCSITIVVSDGYHQFRQTTGSFILSGKRRPNTLQIVSPSQSSKIFNTEVPIEWESNFDDTTDYDIYVSQDGYNWDILKQKVQGNSWNWDIAHHPNTANLRIMLKAYNSDRITYAFSPQFIIKNENHPPELFITEPDNNSTLSSFMRINWTATDQDPGDTIEWINIEYQSPENNERQPVARIESDVNFYTWDISDLKDMQNYTLYITVSDGYAETTSTVQNLQIDNPPDLLQVDQKDSSTIEILFDQNVKNVYRSISFSDDVALRSLRRLSPQRYTITTSPFTSGQIYTMTLDNTITDDTGHPMQRISVTLDGLKDTTAPELSKPVTAIDETHIDLVFTESVLHADKPRAYQINPPLEIHSAHKLTDSIYRLTTAKQEPDKSYQISVEGIIDLAGNSLMTESDMTQFKGFSKKVVRVDPHGNGDYSDLETAIHYAKQGAFIQLTAGVYEHGLHIPSTAHLTIQGGYNSETWEQEDGLESVIISQDEQTAVTCAGIARLIDLRITGAETGVKIYNGQCIMFRCRIFDNQETGLYIMHKASAYIINCAIYENKNVGIGIYTNQDAIILNSIIYNNNSHGITVSSKGNVIIANNIIRKNMYGISLEKSGQTLPVITHTCFYQNNHAQSLDSSYAIIDARGEFPYVINSQENLEKAEWGWTGNKVVNPLWDKNFYLNEKSTLLNAGTQNYDYIFDVLPVSIVPHRKHTKPAGLIEN